MMMMMMMMVYMQTKIKIPNMYLSERCTAFNILADNTIYLGVGSEKTSSKQLTIPERMLYFENIINIHVISQFFKKQIGGKVCGGGFAPTQEKQVQNN